MWKALKRGDRAAFRTFYGRVETRALRLGEHLLGSRQDAEDAVQEAFVALYRTVARFRGESSLETWFFRILVNVCHKARRSRASRARETELDEEPAVHDREPVGEAARLLDHEIRGLPMQQRLVFLLSEVERWSRSEVCQTLNLNPGTVRYHLFQARRTLRHRLRHYFQERVAANGKAKR